MLSATTPLLQAWYARVRAGQPDATNPYVLYAASNLGSFVALLAYPTVVEPLLRLTTQRMLWTGGYFIFIAVIVALGVLVWRTKDESQAPPLAPTAEIPWREKLTWVLLAAAPASLMLGVTLHLSVDIASAPFLWVIPLALYLLTFVLAFQAKPLIPLKYTLVIQAALVAACVACLPFTTAPWPFMFAVNILTFFFTALMCHQTLAARRPPPDRLTEFYLWLAVGGVLGGIFNALIAPLIFTTVREYPLVLLAATLARRGMRGKPQAYDWIWLTLAVLFSGACWSVYAALRAWPDLYGKVYAPPGASVYRGSPPTCPGVRGARGLHGPAQHPDVLPGADGAVGRGPERGGPLQLAPQRAQFLRRAARGQLSGGAVRQVRLHAVDERHHLARRREPGAVLAVPPDALLRAHHLHRPGGEHGAEARAASGHRRGGLGTGYAVAAYERPTDTLTYFEIDPKVLHFAFDPHWSGYATRCRKGPLKLVMGDARLSLRQTAAMKFDLLIVDAFSSDSVPTHLLTQEALRAYLRVMKPGGVVLLHLSNRNLEIDTSAASTVRAVGAPVLEQNYVEDSTRAFGMDSSTDAVIFAKSPEALSDFAADKRWAPPPRSKTKPWTDDYTNLIGALWRRMQQKRAQEEE